MKIKKNILGALDITLIDKWVLSIVKNQGVLPKCRMYTTEAQKYKKGIQTKKKTQWH